MTLGDLLKWVRPPVSVPAARDWETAERALRIRFSSEYRAVVEAFGRGYFEPGVVLWDPRSTEFERDISVELQVMADPELGYPNNGQPHPPYPGNGSRLLPVAANGSAGYLMAVIVDGVQEESEYWVCDLDADNFTKIDASFADVVLILTGDSSPMSRAWHFSAPFHPL